jgi:Leucine-rich repeat (LRR) protein
MFFHTFFLFLVIHLGQAQITLDGVLLRSLYSDYATATTMSLNSKLITHIDHSVFSGVNAIQSIDLSNNSITAITQAFNPYYYYMVYYANSCYNAVAAPGITCPTTTHLRNLMTINLSNNKISHIDENSMLGGVCDTLDLSYNSLSKLVYNQLFSVIGTSYPTPKLRVLNLSYNKLTDISQLFTYSSTYYSKLTHIYLSSNLLTTITPTTFKNVLSLSHLFLNDNKITAIDQASFSGLTNVRELHLYSNPFYPEAPTVSQLLYLLQFCTLANPSCKMCSNALCSLKLGLV